MVSLQKKYDIPLLIVALILVLVGLLFVYSASSYTAANDYGNKYYFVLKQSVGACVGVVFMVALMFINVNVLKKFWIVGVIVTVILLALVFVPGIGIENYGARRWLGRGGFSLQPSEIAKFAFVLFSAVYMSKKDMSKFKNSLPVWLVGGIFCVLIIAEPNMSITMCVGLLMITMLFFSGMKIKHFVMMLIPVVALVPMLILIEPYRIKRLLAFLDPWASPKDEGYQLIQSLYALGNGDWFGVGLFNSRQKYQFLPFAESDFVFSIIGEETGLIGCLLLFCAYGFVVWRGIKISLNCQEKYTCYLSAGITAVFAIQSLINFAVVTGSIPPTGLPLPFISYGGTSLVVFMSAMGVLLNCSKNG